MVAGDASVSEPESESSTAPKTVQQYLDDVPEWRDGTPLTSPPKTSMQRLIFALASAGKLFEGLVVFMTGMALPLIVTDLDLNAAEAGLVTATSLSGILVGALFLGSLSDKLGRKTMFIAEMVMFTGFLVGVCLAPNLTVLLVCLFGVGLALGCDYPTAHMMLSETSSSADRGKGILSAFAFQAIGAVTGAALAVAVLTLATPSVSEWRVMFGIVIIPAAVVTIGRFFVVQSPHWLWTVGRGDEAEQALKKLLQRQPQFPSQVKLVDADNAGQRRGKYSDLFRNGEHGCLRATILASVPWFLQDLSTYGIGIFTPVVIAAAIGNSNDDGIMDGTVAAVIHDGLTGAEGAFLIDLFLVVGILFAIRYLNRFGSIKMQIWGFIGCAAGLAIAAIGDSIGDESWATVLIFVGFMVFTFMTNAGPNAQTYLIAGEVFPTALRGSGSGLAAACGKVGAVLTAFLFPMLLTKFGTTPILIVLIGCSLVGAAVTSIFRIDTTGKSLEEVQPHKK